VVAKAGKAKVNASAAMARIFLNICVVSLSRKCAAVPTPRCHFAP
jgi:hypothetical protein